MKNGVVMLNQSSQSIHSKNILIEKIDSHKFSNRIYLYANKIKMLEVDELKSYLGIAYFIFVTLF